jgi:hypothetical protein
MVSSPLWWGIAAVVIIVVWLLLMCLLRRSAITSRSDGVESVLGCGIGQYTPQLSGLIRCKNTTTDSHLEVGFGYHYLADLGGTCGGSTGTCNRLPGYIVLTRHADISREGLLLLAGYCKTGGAGSVV